MSITSQTYLDIIGVERAWPKAYDSCIAQDCPECGAAPLEQCTNPITRRYRKTPCIRRLTGWN